MRTAAAFLFISVQVWGAASQVSMLISSHGNCTEAWVNCQFAGPGRERGRVRVNFELIEVLDNDPSPSSSTLQQGERRQKTEAIRDYLSD